MSPKSKVRSPKLPFVFVNMAMTADGKIATANRAVSSFGSARDHKHLLELRATADAVMAGARTVDSAAINLGPGPARFRRLRLKNGLAGYNLRVIVSGSGSLNPKAEVFNHRFSPIIILTTAAHRKRSGFDCKPSPTRLKFAAGVKSIFAPRCAGSAKNGASNDCCAKAVAN